MMSNQFSALFTQDHDEMNQNGSKKQKRRTRAKKKKTNTRTTISLATPIESSLSSHDNAWSQGAPTSVATPPPIRTHTSYSHGGDVDRYSKAPPKQKKPVSFTGGEFPSLSESTRGLPSKTGFQQKPRSTKPTSARSQQESSGHGYNSQNSFAAQVSMPNSLHNKTTHKNHYTITSSRGSDEPSVPNQPVGPRAGRQFVQQKHSSVNHHQQQQQQSSSVQATRKYDSNHIPGGQLMEDVKQSHHNVYNKKLTRSAPSPQVRNHKPHKAQQPQNNNGTALPKMQRQIREEEHQVQREIANQVPDQGQFQRPPSPHQQRGNVGEVEKPQQHIEVESEVSESASDSVSDYGQQQQQHQVANNSEVDNSSQPDINTQDNGFSQNQPTIPQHVLVLNMECILQRVTVLENQVKQLAEQNNHLRSELFQRAKLQNQLGQEHIKLYTEMVKFRSEMNAITASQKQSEKIGLSIDREISKQQAVGGFPQKLSQNGVSLGGGIQGAPPGFQHPSLQPGLSSYQPMQQLGGGSSYFNNLTNSGSGSLMDNFDNFNVPGLMHNSMRDLDKGLSDQLGGNNTSSSLREQSEGGLDHSQNRSSSNGLMAYQPQTQQRQNLHHNPLHNSVSNLLHQSAGSQSQQHINRNQHNPLHNTHSLGSSDQGGLSSNYQGYSSLLEQRYNNNGQQEQRNEQVYENFRALLIGNDQMNNQL